MTISEAMRAVLSKYATISGRAARPEFWWWVLAVFLVLLVANLIDAVLLMPLLGGADGQPLSFLVALAVIVPNIAVGVRRLHDTDRSGWWILIALIPLIGTLVLIWFYIQPGSTGENRFGPPPVPVGA